MEVVVNAPVKFIEFPKIGRLSRDMIITEKIDGTNASIYIGESGEFLIGSRTQWITPERDNHGFAKWAMEHKDELMQLGAGSHFGEWWGSGIQRGYGLQKGEKRFSLFNVGRWLDAHGTNGSEPRGKQQVAPACCYVVPILLQWSFDTTKIEQALTDLRTFGSKAVPGFMNPEGVVIFHTASGALFKKTLEKDDEWKGKSSVERTAVRV
jgi:hypothetical protein